jgi:hypothetical protein
VFLEFSCFGGVISLEKVAYNVTKFYDIINNWPPPNIQILEEYLEKEEKIDYDLCDERKNRY